MYIIMIKQGLKWRNECFVYSTKKEAEERKRFLLSMLKIEENKIQIFKIKSVEQ